MGDHDMGHLEHLSAVAAEDVREVRRKEETYQGSWKRRGGVGAFMMLARKWDRMEGILQVWSPHNPGQGGRPVLDPPYDLFSHITRDPLGADGTVLAEVRDLRRYLLLVEAEMVARGVVALPVAMAELTPFAVLKPHRVALDCTACNQVLADGEEVVRDKQDSWWHLSCYMGREAADRTIIPEARHSWPEPVSQPLRPSTVEGPYPHDKTEEWDNKHQRIVAARLEDGLMDLPTGDPRCRFYLITGAGYYLVDRPNVPEEMWEHLPRLPIEENHKEWSELPPEYQGLYTRNEEAAKWIMEPRYREHWGRQP